MRRKNDILLKSAFEEAFQDLLRFFFKDADEIFDFQRGFEFMDKELTELFPELKKKGGSRFADMLVKTRLMSGKDEWILIHIEIQDQHDQYFAERMFQYFYRIYDRYKVPTTAIAVFTGRSKGKVTQFQYDFLGSKLTYEYNTYHILNHSEAELLQMDNLFALTVLAVQKALLIGKIPDEELGKQRLLIARSLILSKKYDNDQIRRFLFFLKTFVYIENREINFKFDKEIDSLTDQRSAMGILETIYMLTREEGLAEGMKVGAQQKSREFVTKLLLAEKFTTKEIANFASVSEALVKKIQKELPQ